MKVLIIPEDPTLDQHVVRPVIARIFEDLGQRARVEVLTDPHLRGVAQALAPQIISGIVDDNPMVDLFIIAVDRDCDRDGNEAKAHQRVLEHPRRLIACLAHQEVEVWALALHRGALAAQWQDVRDDCDPKERFWDPFVATQGWRRELGHGRKRAMRELGRGWSGILQVCPEIAALRDEIARWLAARAGSA